MKNSTAQTAEQPAARTARRKRRKNNKPEMLSRNVEIASFGATVRLYAVHHKGDEPYVESQAWLELRGKATEPVKGVADVKISLYPKDKPEIGTAGVSRRHRRSEAAASLRPDMAAGGV